MRCSSSWIIKS